MAGAVYDIDQLFMRPYSRYRMYPYGLMVQPIAETAITEKKLTKSIEILQISNRDAVHQDMATPDPALACRFDQCAICMACLVSMILSATNGCASVRTKKLK